MTEGNTKRRSWLRCMIAVPFVIIGAVVRAEFLQLLGSSNPFISYYPAVVVAALLGGLPAGLLATALSVLFTDYLLIEPVGQIGMTNPVDVLATFAFSVSCVLMSGVNEAMHRALRRATAAEKELALSAEREKAAIKISETEKRYHALFEHMLDGFAYCRMLFDDRGAPTDFLYLDINSAFVKLTGVSDVVGKKVTEVFPGIKESAPELFAIYGRVVQTGEPERFETEFKPLGKWLSVSVYSPGKDHFVAVFDDITARKRADEAIQESEQKFSKIFNLSPVGITISTLADGRFVDINAAGERLSGYPRNEVIGRTALEFNIWNDPLERSKTIEEVLKHGEVRDKEMTMKTKAGELFWALFSAVVIELKGEKYLLSLVSDITIRKQAEVVLRENEQRFKTLAAATSEGVAITEHGRILDINERFTQIFGFERSELLGREVADLLPPEERERVLPNIRLGRESDIEHAILCGDGSRRIVEAHGKTIDLNGRQLRITAIQDITERKRAEAEIERLNTDLAARAAELEAANRDLEAFNYTVAHDLRKPLTTVNGYCQVIQELCGGKLDEQCKEYLQEAYDGTWRMNQLVDTLLNFSRLTHLELQHEMVDLSGVAQAVAAELKLTEPARQATFQITEGISVIGDANLLRVVLENLLGNAMKYTGVREDAVIEVGVAQVDGNPVYFVRDNGGGFDMAHADKLFIPFQRLPGAEGIRGHGIGLATVERIIRRHGGRVWAEGELGKGATFYFTLS